jgi:mRNA-degrading endonuclease RelE of RelBE toxin-antitoxin system
MRQSAMSKDEMKGGATGYEIRVWLPAERVLRTLGEKELDQVLKKIAALAKTPQPKDATKLVASHNRWRLKVGDIRIIYTVNEISKHVLIWAVRHKGDEYRWR